MISHILPSVCVYYGCDSRLIDFLEQLQVREYLSPSFLFILSNGVFVLPIPPMTRIVYFVQVHLLKDHVEIQLKWISVSDFDLIFLK